MDLSLDYGGLNQTPPHQISKRPSSSVDLYHFSSSFDDTIVAPSGQPTLYQSNTNFSDMATPERKILEEYHLLDDGSILPKNSRSPATNNNLSRPSSLDDYSRFSEIRRIDDEDETPRVASVELRPSKLTFLDREQQPDKIISNSTESHQESLLQKSQSNSSLSDKLQLLKNKPSHAKLFDPTPEKSTTLITINDAPEMEHIEHPPVMDSIPTVQSDSLFERLEFLEAEHSSWKNTEQELQAEIQMLKQQVFELSSKNNQLSQKVTELNDTSLDKQLIDKYQSDLEEEQNRYDVLLKDFTKLKTENQKLEVKYTELSEKLAKNEAEVRNSMRIAEDKFEENVKLLKEIEKFKRNSIQDNSNKQSDKRIQELEKTLEEQEKIIAATQESNVTVMKQMKTLQQKLKEKEDELKQKNIQLNEIQSVESNPSVNTLKTEKEMELRSIILDLDRKLKNEEEQSYSFREDIQKLNSEKRVLEQQIQQLKKEKDLKVNILSDEQNQIKFEYERLKIENEKLKRNIEWFTENQDLITKNDDTIKTQERMISDLKNKIRELEEEEKPTPRELKRIKELEKEIATLKKQIKQPNNNVTELLKAVRSPEEELERRKLEEKVKLLEEQLQSSEEDSEKRLRGLKQEFEKMKITYEQKLFTLNEAKQKETSKLIQKELDAARDGFHKALKNKDEKIQSLEAELAKERKKKTEKAVSVQQQEIDRYKERSKAYETEILQLKELLGRKDSFAERIDSSSIPNSPAKMMQQEPISHHHQQLIDPVLLPQQQQPIITQQPSIPSTELLIIQQELMQVRADLKSKDDMIMMLIQQQQQQQQQLLQKQVKINEMITHPQITNPSHHPHPKINNYIEEFQQEYKMRELSSRMEQLEQDFKRKEAELQNIIETTRSESLEEQRQTKKKFNKILGQKNDQVKLFEKQLEELVKQLTVYQKQQAKKETVTPMDEPVMVAAPQQTRKRTQQPIITKAPI